MKITLTDYNTGAVIASRQVTLGEFGYTYRANPNQFFDEFEQALYALNNGKPEGVLSDEYGERYTMRFTNKDVGSEPAKTITFNTKREYAAEGQIIIATQLDAARVHFVDVTRCLDGVVRCALNERAIMRAYDEGGYNDNYVDFDEQLELMSVARELHTEHRRAQDQANYLNAQFKKLQGVVSLKLHSEAGDTNFFDLTPAQLAQIRSVLEVA